MGGVSKLRRPIATVWNDFQYPRSVRSASVSAATPQSKAPPEGHAASAESHRRRGCAPSPRSARWSRRPPRRAVITDSRSMMRQDRLIDELYKLAQSCPTTGEDVVKQLYQWEHDASKTWSLAWLAAALAFIGSAALSLLKAEVRPSSFAIWMLVIAGALAIAFGAWTLRRLHGLLPEYLTTLHTFTRLRDRAHPESAP